MAGRRGIFSDFDGTLSPIVPVPGDARPVPGAREALARRVGAGDFVCLVSGRGVVFLQDVVGVEGVVYRGLHGLERAVGSAEAEPVPQAREAAGAVAGAAATLTRAVAALPGAELENKGYALTLHYRRTADPEAAAGPAHEMARAAAHDAGCAVRAGRLCWEILPPVEMDKGRAVEEEAMAAGLHSALFAGDDVGDLAAFDALDRLAAAGVPTTKVGVRSPEAPRALLARADIVLDDPVAVAEYLAAL